MSVRWTGWQEVLDQREKTEQRRKRFLDMDELAKQKRLAEFWQAYADYLELDGIISPSRRTLHRAARDTAKELAPA